MLVLTRKVGQTLRIGQAVVTILGCSRAAVQLGIEAPHDVLILRGEVEPKPESLTDVLPSLDVRLAIAEEQRYLEDKHGGAERPDDIGRETDPRDRPW